jgi:hypothetical protein
VKVKKCESTDEQGIRAQCKENRNPSEYVWGTDP